MWQFIVSAALVGGVSFLQLVASPAFGAKPNFALIVLVILAGYHKDWIARGILVLVAALILTFEPVISWTDAAFAVSAFFSMALVDYLPWREVLNAAVAVLLGTLVIHLASFNIQLFLAELGINALITLILFWLIQLVYEKEAFTYRI